jgi:hypothetical protein
MSAQAGASGFICKACKIYLNEGGLSLSPFEIRKSEVENYGIFNRPRVADAVNGRIAPIPSL